MTGAKRYYGTVKGRDPVTLDVEPLGKGRFAVSYDGKRREVDAHELDHGAVSMLVDGEAYSIEFEQAGDDLAVLVRTQVVRVDIADERKLRLRAAAAAFSVEGKVTVTAPMPGKIVKIFVKPGDAVAEGDGLITVEAMKMENELKSPKAGTVKAVLVKEGALVENNAKLLELE